MSGAFLVTGATGFVGAYVLRELLETQPGTVYCLVRALGDPAVGLHRVRRILLQRGLWSDAYAERIAAVPGDLTRPRLGIDAATARTLVARVRTVIHLAGKVNWVDDAAALETVNTTATSEAAALAAEAGAGIAFLSTMAVFADLTKENLDDAPLPPEETLLNGYGETKRAAERALAAARDRGTRATVFRTANITGDSKGGPAPSNQSFTLFVRACRRVRAAPREDLFFYDILPIDYVASLIVAVTTRAELSGRNYNVILRRRRENQDVVRRVLRDVWAVPPRRVGCA
jgi:myxalamid-type nonribosomal peptide synthetase MxaA